MLSLLYEVLHCVLQREAWSYTGRQRHVLCCTQTILPPLRFGKLPPLLGSLVTCSTLQPRCPCFTLFTMSYSMKPGFSRVGGLCCVHTLHFSPTLRHVQAASPPPCRVALFLVAHSSFVFTVDSVFALTPCASRGTSQLEGGGRRCMCQVFRLHTSSPSCFTTLVKLSSSGEDTLAVHF